MTREQAELVNEAVANGKQVNPLAVNSRVDELSKVFNPYTVGLRTSTDSALKKEPSLEMKKCDLTWSILSTVVDYTENDEDSPYKEMNHSPIYSRYENVNDLITDEQYSSHKFDETNDVSTTYLGYYKSKGDERTFPVDNHIPMDGRGVTAAFLMDNTPIKLFFDSGALRHYLSKKFYDANKSLHRLPKFVTTCTGIKIGNGSIIPTVYD